MSEWQAVIGLEIHAQLATESKIFSAAPTAFGAEANTQVNELCAGHPGSLPVLNRRAVELAVRAGFALDCDVQALSIFDRKNYFYPDLPKGYQISQLNYPICLGGHVDYDVDGQPQRTRLERIHMEEDAGKSQHEGEDPHSHIDLNRAGTPLIEIVTHPEIHTPEAAAAFFRAVREVLVCVGANDGRLAEGSLRCDANVSVRPAGSEVLNTRTEIKNLNSFRFVRDAVRHEIDRQIALIESGGSVVQQTRLWDETRNETRVMRTKEGEADYRYFPDPDLPPVLLDAAWLESVRASLPELPAARRARYRADYELSAADAAAIVDRSGFATVFEAAIAAGCAPRQAAIWVNGELASAINDELLAWRDSDNVFVSSRGVEIDGPSLAALQGLVDDDTVSIGTARRVLRRMIESGLSAAAVVDADGLRQVDDSGQIEAAVRAVIEANPDEVAAFRGGRKQLIGFFIGQVMRATKGRAKPDTVRRLVIEALAGDAG